MQKKYFSCKNYQDLLVFCSGCSNLSCVFQVFRYLKQRESRVLNIFRDKDKLSSRLALFLKKIQYDTELSHSYVQIWVLHTHKTHKHTHLHITTHTHTYTCYTQTHIKNIILNSASFYSVRHGKN